MRAREAGVSEAIGTILMIALVVVLAAAVYVFVGPGADAPAPPPAVGLNQETGATPSDRTFVIAQGTPGLRWNELALMLDGAPMSYDSSLTSARSYCVIVTGDACMPTSLWDPKLLVAGGQRLAIHDTTLSGKRLLVTAPEANAGVLSIALA